MKDSAFIYNRAGATVASGTTFYVEVPVNRDGSVNVQIAWLDATTAATITLELSNYGSMDAAADAAAAHYWSASGESITGPDGSAIGSTVVSAVVGTKRARLKIVTSADSKIQVL